MIALKAARIADELVGKFVMRQPNEPGGKTSLGYFYAICEEDMTGGWVFDFATKQHVPSVPSRCVVVPARKVERGVHGIPVLVPLFGTGVIIEEYMRGSQLRVRVKFDGSERMMLVNFIGVEIMVPPRG